MGFLCSLATWMMNTTGFIHEGCNKCAGWAAIHPALLVNAVMEAVFSSSVRD